MLRSYYYNLLMKPAFGVWYLLIKSPITLLLNCHCNYHFRMWNYCQLCKVDWSAAYAYSSAMISITNKVNRFLQLKNTQPHSYISPWIRISLSAARFVYSRIPAYVLPGQTVTRRIGKFAYTFLYKLRYIGHFS